VKGAAMDAEQFDKIYSSLNRIAAALLTTAVTDSMTRKPTLKELQTVFNDCYMIVNPMTGTDAQATFQERINKKEW
jgi:hypothetical protein